MADVCKDHIGIVYALNIYENHEQFFYEEREYIMGKEQEHQKEERLQEQLKHIKHTIVVMSGKGGVGKSTVATNLAVALAQHNYTIGLMDADIHGPDVPKMLGMENAQFLEIGVYYTEKRR